MSAAPSPHRRGACPTLAAPMLTGDGYLARIAFTDACPPGDLARLFALAARHGNGAVDITARGGLQFRGLTEPSAAALSQDVAALGLPLRDGVAVETSPLGGLDKGEIADPNPVANRIRTASAALGLYEKLAPKLSVVVDGGGQWSMDALAADIRLKAVAAGGETMWRLTVGSREGEGRGDLEKSQNALAGLLPADAAVDAVMALLDYLAGQGSAARGRDLDSQMIKALCGDLSERFPFSSNSENALTLAHAAFADGSEAIAPAPAPLGLIELGDDLAAAAAAPAFGQADAKALVALCEAARSLGIGAVRPAPSLRLLFFASPPACRRLVAQASVSDFIVAAGDPRASIVACPGRPACASALVDTRELAQFAATHCTGLLDGSFSLHISGCAKGCAHPAPAFIGLCGDLKGVGLALDAPVSAAPQTHIAGSDRFAALSRLARLHENEHKPAESVRACFARLGAERLGSAFRQDDA